MAVNPVDQLRGLPPAATPDPATARVTKRTPDGVWAAPIGGDHRTPIGPCRGGDDLVVGDTCLLIWTAELPWVVAAPHRPVGEVTMWLGPTAQIPAGWLPLDGATFSADTYPVLADQLGSTTLPDLTDDAPPGLTLIVRAA